MRNLILAMLCALTTMSFLGSCSKDTSTPIRIQMNWFPEPQFGGIYTAQAKGYFEDAGLDVKLLKGGPSVPAPQMVASGNVEFAVVSAPQLITLRSQGGAATGVFATFQKYPRGILVHADSPYQELKAFWKSDSKLMAEDGLAYIKWLKNRYGQPSVLFVPYAGSLAPFISRTVQGMQCFATAEPVQLKVQGVETRVFYLADEGYNPYVAVIAVNDDVLKKRPEMVKKFVNAIRRGWSTYLADPAETNALLLELNPDLSREVLDLASAELGRLVESDTTRANAPGWMTAERWNTLLGQLVELDELSSAGREKVGEVFINLPLEGGSQASASK
ncbi:MAG: ABC transporter substrate-binding protein [Phycisphaerales bacterium]|nr:ABC transporter substrate-binding protein [Phycisphaerales bacterium]